jgi:hypothetical protein
MSDNEKRKKPAYEAPTVVDLSGLAGARGQIATCDSSGSGAITTCTVGTAATATCTTNGSLATVTCSGNGSYALTCSVGSHP